VNESGCEKGLEGGVGGGDVYGGRGRQDYNSQPPPTISNHFNLHISKSRATTDTADTEEDDDAVFPKKLVFLKYLACSG
jgi:hypothetical protein